MAAADCSVLHISDAAAAGKRPEIFSRIWCSFLRYVTVYLVFQEILFLITASVGMISFSLAETTADGNSLWYIFASYFRFSLEAPLEEVNAIAAGEMSLFPKTGTLVGSLTGVASYWVLNDMVAEHIWEEKKTPFHKLHDYLYKKNYPEKIGKLMRDKYENGQIRNESEFKEVLKNVLFNC